MAIGEEIKERRERLGWSQPELAHRSGAPQQSISSIEKGRTRHSRYTTMVLEALRKGEDDRRSSKKEPHPETSAAQPDLDGERYIKVPESQLVQAFRLLAEAQGTDPVLAADLSAAVIELLSEPPLATLGGDPLQSFRVRFELLARRLSFR